MNDFRIKTCEILGDLLEYWRLNTEKKDNRVKECECEICNEFYKLKFDNKSIYKTQNLKNLNKFTIITTDYIKMLIYLQVIDIKLLLKLRFTNIPSRFIFDILNMNDITCKNTKKSLNCYFKSLSINDNENLTHKNLYNNVIFKILCSKYLNKNNFDIMETYEKISTFNNSFQTTYLNFIYKRIFIR